MKTLLFHYRILFTMMITGILMMDADAFGQVSDFNDTNCSSPAASAGGDCSAAIGENADAQSAGSVAVGRGALATGLSSSAFGNFASSGGDHSVAVGDAQADGEYSSAFGQRAIALGERGMAVGNSVKTTATTSNNFIFGSGYDVGILENDISNSIMIGVNSDVSTIFVGNSGGTAGSYGNVGIGDITDPASLLHVRDSLRLGLASNDNGSILFNNEDNTNTVAFVTGETSTSHTYLLPVAPGDDLDVLTYNTGGQLTWEEGGGSDDWEIDGNSNINISNHFLGTTNNVDVAFRANNIEVIRIDASVSRVGIGTAAPNAKLEVSAEAETGGESIGWFTVGDATEDRLRIRNGSNTAGEFIPVLLGQVENHNLEALRFTASTDNDAGTSPIMAFQSRLQNPLAAVATRPLFRWSDYLTTVMQMDANGNLGIGTTTPDGRLDVNGTMFISSIPAGSVMTDSDLGFDGNGQLVDLSSSTIEFKENVEDIEFNQEAFLNLRPVNFKWKDFYGGNIDVGLIAQEVDQTFPELALRSYKRTYLPNGDMERDSLGIPVVDSTQQEVRGVRYHKLPVYLLALAKDQQSEIDELRGQIENLTSIVQNCCAVEPSYRLGEEGETGFAEMDEKDMEEYVLLGNDPNPFADYTDINYRTSSCNDCQIIITDMNGRMVKRIPLRSTEGKVRVYSSEIGSGVFMYSIVEDGQVIGTSKMVSSK